MAAPFCGEACIAPTVRWLLPEEMGQVFEKMCDFFEPTDDEEKSTSEEVEQRRLLAAQLVESQRTTLLSRIHSLLGDDSRKITDTDDILSTALRRVDRVILRGKLEAQNSRQFYAFVHGVIERTILEKARKSRGVIARERIAQEMSNHQKEKTLKKQSLDSEKLDQIGRVISDPVDREIVLLKGRGLSLEAISESMKMSSAAVRKRWSRIRSKVRTYLAEESFNDDCE